MKKLAFMMAIVIFITLTGVSMSSAQSTNQTRSSDARPAEKFTAEPITIETPTGTLYGL